jgi:hypothetical protein
MPARDLWPGISARITARRRPWATLASRPWALAAAAAVLVALGVVAGRLGGPSAVGPQASLPGARPASVETGHIRDAEKEYARATADLMEALRTRRAALSPETLNAVEANLKTIDEALEELHAALEKDPENRKLTQMLASTHQKKLDLLLRLLKLSSRI